MLIVGITGFAVGPEGKFAGVKGVGKDTLASMLQAYGAMRGVRVHIFRFADALKDMVAEYMGIERADWDTPVMKETPLPGLENGLTYRKALELFGTNVVRRVEAMDDVWLNKVRHKILRLGQGSLDRLVCQTLGLSDAQAFDVPKDHPLQPFGRSWNHLKGRFVANMHECKFPMIDKASNSWKTIVLITDVRFPNEGAMIRKEGGLLLQVRRPTAQPLTNMHPSNLYYPELAPDLTELNDRTKEQLLARVPSLFDQLTGKLN